MKKSKEKQTIGRPVVFTHGRQRINFHAEPELVEKLKAIAKEENIAINELLRRLLRNAVNEAL